MKLAAKSGLREERDGVGQPTPASPQVFLAPYSISPIMPSYPVDNAALCASRLER